MINDYISIQTANVIDLGFNIDVVLDNSQNQGSVITQIITIVGDYFSPENMQLGQNGYISELKKEIQNQNGVITVSDIKVYNKVGGQYSSSQTSMAYVDSDTKEIKLVDDTLFSEPNQIYQVRFPNKDINVRVKNLATTAIS
jgi:Tfp pilus assembly protein PilW